MTLVLPGGNWVWHSRCLIVITGLTGSGKTDLLERLASIGEQVIDLEKLAHHRGSVFGGINRPRQPAHRAFVDMVTSAWHRTEPTRPVWIEDEGPFIGSVGIPTNLQRVSAIAPVVELVADIAERRARLLAQYAASDVEDLVAALDRAADRLGSQRFAAVSAALRAGDRSTAVAELLGYYDAAYAHRLNGQRRALIARFGSRVDPLAVVAATASHVREWLQRSGAGEAC